MGGIAQEIVDRLQRKGASPGHLPDSSDYVATITPFDPEVHKALLLEMMQEAGVTLLLHAYFLTAQVDGDEVRGATFATVGGNRAYGAPVVDRRDRRCAGRRVSRRADAARRRARPRSAGNVDVPPESRRSREARAVSAREPRPDAHVPCAAGADPASADRSRGSARSLGASSRRRYRRRSARAGFVLYLAVSRRGDGQHDARHQHRSARPRRSHAGRGAVAPAGDAAARVFSAARSRF